MDDLLLLWEGTETEAAAFIRYINDNDRNKNFTYAVTENTVDFLDIILRGDFEKSVRIENPLRVTILAASSCHPPT